MYINGEAEPVETSSTFSDSVTVLTRLETPQGAPVFGPNDEVVTQLGLASWYPLLATARGAGSTRPHQAGRLLRRHRVAQSRSVRC